MPMLHRRARLSEPPLVLTASYGMPPAEGHVMRLPANAFRFATCHTNLATCTRHIPQDPASGAVKQAQVRCFRSSPRQDSHSRAALICHKPVPFCTTLLGHEAQQMGEQCIQYSLLECRKYLLQPGPSYPTLCFEVMFMYPRGRTHVFDNQLSLCPCSAFIVVLFLLFLPMEYIYLRRANLLHPPNFWSPRVLRYVFLPSQQPPRRCWRLHERSPTFFPTVSGEPAEAGRVTCECGVAPDMFGRYPHPRNTLGAI